MKMMMGKSGLATGSRRFMFQKMKQGAMPMETNHFLHTRRESFCSQQSDITNGVENSKENLQSPKKCGNIAASWTSASKNWLPSGGLFRFTQGRSLNLADTLTLWIRPLHPLSPWSMMALALAERRGRFYNSGMVYSLPFKITLVSVMWGFTGPALFILLWLVIGIGKITWLLLRNVPSVIGRNAWVTLFCSLALAMTPPQPVQKPTSAT